MSGTCQNCGRDVNLAAFTLCHVCYKEAVRTGGIDAYREQAGRDAINPTCRNCGADKGDVRFTTVDECNRCYKYRRSHDGAYRPLYFASTPSLDLGGDPKPMWQVKAENPTLAQFLDRLHTYTTHKKATL